MIAIPLAFEKAPWGDTPRFTGLSRIVSEKGGVHVNVAVVNALTKSES